MSLKLVLAEKPSVGREIARVLNCKNNKGSYIEGNGYIVTWALGHLIGLMDPEGYGDKYKKWSMETLPMLPNDMKLTVLKKTSKQFYDVKKQLLRKDVQEIIIATDAGREGELVARWILEYSNCRKPIKRLWISSQTDKAIKEGFKNLKDGNLYNNLYKAAVCRAEADWLVGLNVTRALTCKYNAQLSAGRVQSPTLALITKREEEITKFIPKKYETITVIDNKNIAFAWRDSKGKAEIFDTTKTQEIKGTLNGKILIEDVNESLKKEYAPGLYDLTELQRDCNKLYGFSPKETLNIMQRLYENHKVLTYPRTDSKYISEDIVPTLKDRIKGSSNGEHRIYCEELLRSQIKTNKSFVDNKKVSDHHAIIPTEENIAIKNLSQDEKKVYNLVIKRFLSVFYPPYSYIEKKVIGKVNGEILIAKGKTVKDLGYKKIYKDRDEIKDQILPNIEKGEEREIAMVSIGFGETLPPQRFTEASLLSAMEKPQKYISLSNSAAKTLGETGGLGTVATRADIIEKLFKSFVIEKKNKFIVPTSKGKQLIDLVPEELKSPLLTAQWENKLENISKGNENPNFFIKDMKDYSSKLVNEVKGGKSTFTHDNKTGTKCPNCGKYMLEVNGKQGRMLVCQDRECGYRQSLARLTNARCPECKKKLELRGNGEGKIYVCTGSNCSFREKASTFEKRFDKKGKVDKREVNNIMKKMKKEAEESLDNPFAALGDLFNK